MEQIELLGNVGLKPWLQSFQQPYQVKKEDHVQASAKISGYFEYLKEREIHLNLQAWQAESGKVFSASLAWFLALIGY